MFRDGMSCDDEIAMQGPQGGISVRIMAPDESEFRADLVFLQEFDEPPLGDEGLLFFGSTLSLDSLADGSAAHIAIGRMGSEQLYPADANEMSVVVLRQDSGLAADFLTSRRSVEKDGDVPPIR